MKFTFVFVYYIYKLPTVPLVFVLFIIFINIKFNSQCKAGKTFAQF